MREAAVLALLGGALSGAYLLKVSLTAPLALTAGLPLVICLLYVLTASRHRMQAALTLPSAKAARGYTPASSPPETAA
jgi:hypothetical protein